MPCPEESLGRVDLHLVHHGLDLRLREAVQAGAAVVGHADAPRLARVVGRGDRGPLGLHRRAVPTGPGSRTLLSMPT